MRNIELEAEIAKSPEDPAPYLVYADWLQQQGDPRGELIALSVQVESDRDNAEITARLAALHAAHDAEWLGLAGPTAGTTLGWRRGFVDFIQIGDDDSAEIDMAETYKTVRTATRDKPAAALIRRLKLAAFQDEDDYQPSWSGVTKAMVEHGVPATLRTLEYDRGDYWDISNTSVDGLEALYPQLANLEKLYIELGNMDLGAIDLPSLRDFEVYTGGFTGDNMRSVLAAKWPKLERLILRFGNSEDYGGTTTFEDVLPLFSSTNFKHVKHLGLGNAAFVDDAVAALAKSKLLAQLETLELSKGLLGDAGAGVMIEHHGAFKHLKRIDASESYISKPVATRLAEVLPNTTIGQQEDPNNDYRYCQIGE